MVEYASQKDRTLILVNVNMASLAKIVKIKVRVSHQVGFELGILQVALSKADAFETLKKCPLKRVVHFVEIAISQRGRSSGVKAVSTSIEKGKSAVRFQSSVFLSKSILANLLYTSCDNDKKMSF